MHYIFGYGSLICADSRSRTGVSGPAHPIEVKGIARRWSLHSPEWQATALSAHQQADAHCNGVYFAVDQANLAKFDQRELGYDRIQVNWEDVTALSDESLPTKGVLWAYVGKKTGQPTPEKPIMQSYLDVILNGCLHYGEDFSRRFTEQTELWKHLVNDREKPQYPRPLKTTTPHKAIDQILKSHLSDLWHMRTTQRHK